jgi:phosphomannomutase
MQKNIVFGTDGWRGIIDEEVNNKSIAVIAQAFADYLLRSVHIIISPSVIIGYDGRKNSRQYATLFARVLSGNRINVLLSDRITPTPVLSFAVKNLGMNAGVMITASHNPSVYNGVKFKDSYGGPMLTENTKKVESLINYNLIQTDETFKTVNLLEDYFASINERIDFKLIRKKQLKVLIDSMGGAGSTILEELLKKNKIKSETIFGVPDPDFFGRSPEPIDINLSPLKNKISKGDYSFGIATDGDADRVSFVLDNGEWLSAQETILILTDYLVGLGFEEGDIVKTVSVTDKLKQLELGKRKIREVQVGFKYITEQMIGGKVAMGFEESGGFGLSSHIPERDGILFALIMLEMLADSQYSKLSDLVREKREKLGLVYYDRIDFKYDESNRMELIPRLLEALPKTIEGFSITDRALFYSATGIVNGLKLRLEGNSRWLLFRSSETESLIRFYAEGDSSEEPDKILKAGIKILIK